MHAVSSDAGVSKCANFPTVSSLLEFNPSQQYSEGIFRVPTLERWVVIINKPDLTREVRRVPEDVISSMAFANEVS